MKRDKQILAGVFSTLAMCIIILDTKTAFLGATEGISICLQTVIPSLFPFIVLSVMINTSFRGRDIPLLRPLGRLTGIPAGCEYILLLGLLGGYPVGAQCIADAHRNGNIDTSNARRMLGFCNNAGPAFIFGIVGSLLTVKGAVFALWLIHIASALITGILLPNKSHTGSVSCTYNTMPFTKTLEESARIMVRICVWVIIFRVVLRLCNNWFMGALPSLVQVLFTGLLELSNGCIALSGFSQPIIFVLSGCFLSFGGFCVAMQTVSATGTLGTGLYFPGKLLQTAICLGMSIFAQFFLFEIPIPIKAAIPIALLCAIITISTYIVMQKKKKVVAIPC